MKKKIFNIIIILVLLIPINYVFAQTQSSHNIYFTIPEIALLDIEPNTNDVILNFSGPTEAGDGLNTPVDQSKVLQYTSNITKGGSSRSIAAQISGGSMIPGLQIELAVASYSGTGEGDFGASVGSVELTSTAQTIITGVGGCYTNTNSSSGHSLEYSASISDYSVFEIPTQPSVDITFTISD